MIFVAITASFYASLGAQVPGIDASDPVVRSAIAPLNPPRSRDPRDQVVAAKAASVDAFHLAALVSAVLMAAGSATSAVGLRGGGAAGGVAKLGASTDAPPGAAAG